MHLRKELIAKLSGDFGEDFGIKGAVEVKRSDTQAAEGEFISPYILRKALDRNVSVLMADNRPVGSSVEEIDEPRVMFAECQDAVMNKEAHRKSLLPVLKELMEVRLICDELRRKDGNAPKCSARRVDFSLSPLFLFPYFPCHVGH